MDRQSSKIEKLKALRERVSVPSTPSPYILETFSNPGATTVEFSTDEFTSLCPVTGQPDWCSIVIKYTPNTLCVESKSLKLYLQSYRNEHGFIEELATRIFEDISTTLKPLYLEVVITATPRGGLSLTARKSSKVRWFEWAD
ncbi:MAG: NADPH-dependent 7-cyano-7-deazaguanine reductase [Actinobacteria bacterium]|nr:NADPH-dependent 7-cyano-7-deazaguanine reductase [Actinomycetota bacterium]